MKTNAAIIVPPGGGMDLATNDIRGIRPPLEVAGDWAWLWWVALLLVALVASLLFWSWWRKRPAPVLVIPVVPPHIRARQKLSEAMLLIHDSRAFCILVSDTIRIYLEERFDFRAPERTTEEFLAELQSTNLLSPDQKQSLGEFLQSCDLVKFARFEPTEAALRDLHDAASRLVDETQYERVEAPKASTTLPPLPPPAGTNDDLTEVSSPPALDQPSVAEVTKPSNARP